MIRLDKFLKLSQLVKRRTAAQEMIGVGAVRVNGRKVKPVSDVKAGDLIEVAFPRRFAAAARSPARCAANEGSNPTKIRGANSFRSSAARRRPALWKGQRIFAPFNENQY